MGGAYSSSALSDSATVDVAVPAELLWEVIADLEAAPDILSQVSSIRRKSGGDFEVGTRWRETRMHKGQQIPQHKTITAITGADSFPRSVCINVSYHEVDSYRDDINTSTLMVDSVDETNARLIGTLAFQTMSFQGRTRIFLCKPCFMSMVHTYFQAEMEDYAAAAERRYQERLLSPSENKGKRPTAIEKVDAKSQSNGLLRNESPQ
jgi:hypothetical protein